MLWHQNSGAKPLPLNSDAMTFLMPNSILLTCITFGVWHQEFDTTTPCSFHGWVILFDYPENVMWSLWNPLTSKIIRLPPLIDNKDEEEKEKGGVEEATDKEEEDADEEEKEENTDEEEEEEEEEDTDEEEEDTDDKEEEDWHECCLSSPPDDPNSIFLLATSKKKIQFCRLDCKRERLRWTETSYDEQLRSITNNEDSFLFSLAYCNCKVYALNTGHDCDLFVIQIEIVVQDREVVIRLLPLVKRPSGPEYCCNNHILKGSCSELFAIYLCSRFKLCYVYCYKLDMTSMLWEEMTDLKDAIFFVDICHDDSVNYSPAIASELGNYIHIVAKTEEVIYSYNVKDKTLTPSSISHLDLPQRSGESQSYVSVWDMHERRLQVVHNGKIKHTIDCKLEGKKDSTVVHDGVEVDGMLNQHQESPLFNIPVHVLERIMEFSVGVDYLNFRATCKQFSSITVSKRRVLSTLLSPWLMAFDKVKCIFTFTDPVFGDKYFIRAPLEFISDFQIHCSMCGWLLMSTDNRGGLMLFNPFTSDIHKLPHLEIPHPNSFCFSEPPTSPNCKVVALTCIGEWHVYIHFVAQEHSWRKLQMDFRGIDPYAFVFPTLYGRDIYALNDGGLHVFKETKEKGYKYGVVVAEPPKSCSISAEYFQVKCKKRLLLVAVDEHGQ
ncbi:hypothetical protein Tco_1088158 [Tanacetum coccineum]